MKRTVPALSHLQFLALSVLLSGEHAGREVRAAIVQFGIRHTASAFYQFMARLERDGLVEGWYEQVQAADQLVTERRYRITGAGRRALAATRAFYAAIEVLSEGGGLSRG